VAKKLPKSYVEKMKILDTLKSRRLSSLRKEWVEAAAKNRHLPKEVKAALRLHLRRRAKIEELEEAQRLLGIEVSQMSVEEHERGIVALESEIEGVVKKVGEVLKSVEVTYKGKSGRIYHYLKYGSVGGDYVLNVDLMLGKFERASWGRAGTFMARGTRVSLLSERESDELYALVAKELRGKMTRAGFEGKLLETSSLIYGNGWYLTKQQVLNYLAGV
jgi:hypothetical protein